jgi:NDP-sugar pyrophosphorylase family protein
VAGLYDLSQTIAADLFKDVTYPWEALAGISDFIIELGRTLPEDRFEKRGENVWVAKSAKVFDSAYIGGPCIIDHGAEIRHCAFIRGAAIVGKGATVGNSTELKNCILFDKAQAPHYNYVGDSILGIRAHLGAGAITSNLKSDGSNIVIKSEPRIETGLRKIGALVGDYTEVGCGSVLNPGSVIGKRCQLYPLSMFRGVLAADSIYKKQGEVVQRIKG